MLLQRIYLAEIPATREEIRSWLAETGIPSWRERYVVSASEALDLLEFTRVRSRSLLKALLETGSALVDLVDVRWTLPGPDHLLTLERARDGPEPSAPLCLCPRRENSRMSLRRTMQTFNRSSDTGLELTILNFVAETAPATLLLSLATTETES